MSAAPPPRSPEGPIRIGSSSAITAAVVVADLVLASLGGPLGRLQFLQVVGLAAAYVAALVDGRTGWGRASDWPGLRFGIVR